MTAPLVLIFIVGWFIGAGILIMATMHENVKPRASASPKRKHISYPRRRFLRKQARKAHAS